MSAPTVFDDALNLLEGKFANNPAKRKDGFLTAYAAVKLAFGVKRDDHAVAYNGSDWPALATRMSEAFAVLDEVTAGSSDNPVPFIVWCSRPERKEAEVRAVLSEAAHRNPTMVVEDRAQLRPSVAKMPGTRKTRWVICNQLALIAAGRRSSLGAAVSFVLPVDDAPDFDVIEKLDGIIDAEETPWERPDGLDVAVSMSRAWGTKTRKDPTYSFKRFVGEFPTVIWLHHPDDELQEVFETFVEEHKDDEAPVFGAPFLG